MQETLDWLNAWERRVHEKLISPNEFLTASTAEGLRMTLHSTLDLSTSLLEYLKMGIVLTGRINQDSLEVIESRFEIDDSFEKPISNRS